MDRGRAGEERSLRLLSGRAQYAAGVPAGRPGPASAIATTSTGYEAAGRGLNRHRKRQLELRRKLQKKGTESAKRLLKKRSRSEKRHATNQNHIIAKTIVTEAERSSSGISLEELQGIRRRIRLRKPQRVAFAGTAGRESRVPAPIVVPGRRSPPSSQLDATSKPGPLGPGQVDYR